jgi:hypothetical protein
MTDQKKSIDNLDLANRKNELVNVNTLYNHFGSAAFRAIEKQYTGSGYQTGVERLTRLIKNKLFSRSEFSRDPIKGIEEFLHGYFKDRGGNLPRVWSEKNTVYLMTEFNVPCVTIAAEKEVPVPHREICNIYCRAFVKGMLKIFEDFFPGIVINFYNASSRRGPEKGDCVEAFQVVLP